MHNHFISIFHFCFRYLNSKLLISTSSLCFFRRSLNFFGPYNIYPNKENAIRMPVADFAFIPEAEAGVIEDADAKFHNVDVLPASRGAEGCLDKPFYPARSSGAIQRSGLRILFVEEFFRMYLAKPLACQSSDLMVIWNKLIHFDIGKKSNCFTFLIY